MRRKRAPGPETPARACLLLALSLPALALAAIHADAASASERVVERAGESPAAHARPSEADLGTTWRRLVEAEELIQLLDRPLLRLARGIRNLNLPGHSTRALFADTVRLTDLAADGLATPPQYLTTMRRIGVRTARMGEETTTDRRTAKLWQPFFDQVDHVSDAKFGVLAGRFLDDQRGLFEQVLSLKAHGRSRADTLLSVNGKVRLVWARATDASADDAAAWRVAELHTLRFELIETAAPLFEEVLGRAVPDAESRRLARQSEHERLVTQFLTKRASFVPPHAHFTVQAFDRHPSLAVADVDGDGFDDLYVMPELGRNQLFMNQRDGTFRDRAAEYGLDLRDHCSSAIFADFDNDGDLDVFVGRTLLPSMFLEQKDGRFVDRSPSLPKEALPALVASLSAVDYDRDGLLDVYVATYAGSIIERAAYDPTKPAEISADLLAEFIAPADARELRRQIRSGKNGFRDRPGPPNVLLKNAGGRRFEVAPDASALRVFRNTLQATWADFDGDGDDDVYIANDFAPNNFVRNDGGGRFTDITDATGTADVGFGMGITVGDYDADGLQDLYVSNMYSKAGSRITAALPVDSAWAKMARGNTLFRNLGRGFTRVSGRGSSDARVEIAGWSWGGQFADFNNDAHLDLFVPNGYFTSPVEHELPVDI